MDKRKTPLQGLRARAGRAAEDPVAMTVPAVMTRMAKYVARVLKENPDLTAEQAARGAYLLLRAEMAERSAKGVAARRGKAGGND